MCEAKKHDVKDLSRHNMKLFSLQVYAEQSSKKSIILYKNWM